MSFACLWVIFTVPLGQGKETLCCWGNKHPDLGMDLPKWRTCPVLNTLSTEAGTSGDLLHGGTRS